MKLNRKSAVMIGVLYIVATIAGLIGMGVFTEPILSAPDYLTRVPASENQILMGVLFELIMAVAVTGIGIVMYPILRKYHASLAIGYFGARLAEGLIFIIGAVSLLSILTLSQEFVQAGAPVASYFQTAGELLLAARDWAGHVVLDVAIFPLGALILNYVLYQFKLVPRWLSGLGIISTLLYWLAGWLVMFAVVAPLSSIHIALQAPLGLQEMVFAGWLIVKGFNPPQIATPKMDLSEAKLAH